jgi:hypothetical protein
VTASDPEFEAVFDRLLLAAYRIATRMVGDRQLAEDIAAQTMARAFAHMRIQWGDGDYSNGPSRFGCTAMGTCPMFRQRYGPWDPPPPTPEDFTIDFTHTYGKAGTFAVTVDADSADPCSPDQFHASEATRKLDVTVTTPTSSTAP